MTTAYSYSSRGHRCRITLTIATVVLASGLAGMHLGSTARAAAATRNSAYGWPVKPFDREHPVRANLGDPRTIFAGPPNQRTLLRGAGTFQFHYGIDISAPDGTPVYPVVSGRVLSVNKDEDWLAVDAGQGRTFEYWHIAPVVAVGAQVQEDATVLGRIIKGAGHVHLTERNNGVAVNPLAAGHLGPYSDQTKPRVDAVYFRRSVTSGDSMPDFLRGRVELIASAYDLPQLRVPGAWHDLPVTPALVTWRIEQATTHRVVVRQHTAYDVRRAMPSNNLFWRIYARGTHQNMSVFGKHYSYMQPGQYLFRLAPGGFDTRTLRDSVYDLIVTATDIRGNSSSLAVRFSVHNKPGVLGP
jgi:murein DD-endopeptidase MepM/ murein hydrolase activator NlpD